MVLYHGTSEEHLAGILRDGLLPGQAVRCRNWSVGPHIPDVVYLTNRLGWWFAHVTTSRAIEARSQFHRPCIVEVSVGGERLLPDQDYLTQIMEALGVPRRVTPLSPDAFGDAVILATHGVDLTMMGQNRDAQWRPSLDRMGMVAHEGPIPTRQVRRIILLEFPLFVALNEIAEVYWPRLGYHTLVAPDAERIHRLSTGESHRCEDVAVHVDEANRRVDMRATLSRPSGVLRVLTLRHGEVVHERVV